MMVTSGGEPYRVKGVKYMMTEDDLTLGGESTMRYTDHVSEMNT